MLESVFLLIKQEEQRAKMPPCSGNKARCAVFAELLMLLSFLVSRRLSTRLRAFQLSQFGVWRQKKAVSIPPRRNVAIKRRWQSSEASVPSCLCFKGTCGNVSSSYPDRAERKPVGRRFSGSLAQCYRCSFYQMVAHTSCLSGQMDVMSHSTLQILSPLQLVARTSQNLHSLGIFIM